MIDIGVLRTYKKYDGWSNYEVRNIEGYGALSGDPFDEMCEGILVSIVSSDHVNYIFIADKPLLDKAFPTDEDPYLLHSGIFSDERAQGRCWFVDKQDEKDGIIYTSSDGMFHVKHDVGGVLV